MKIERTAKDDSELRLFWWMVALTAAAAMISVVAGGILWIADTAEGSTTNGVLGLTAAVTGLITAALFGAMLIYAQVKNLWRFAPRRFRSTASVVLIVVAIVAVIAVIAVVSSTIRNP